MPMKLLDRYIEASTLKAFALVLLALTTLFSLLEFVDQLSNVGQGHYYLIDAFAYVVLTAPSRVLQLTPVSALLGSLLALGAMAGNGELTAMRAAGVSVGCIIGWVFRLGAPIMIALFLIAEFVIPPAQQLAQSVRASRLSSVSAFRSNNGFWAAGDHRYLHVRRFEYGNTPKGVDIYAFAANGQLRSFIHANRADVRPNGTWLLTGVVRKQFDNARIETDQLFSLSWESFLRPQQVNLLRLSPQSMAPIALYRYIRHLKRQHQDTARYEQALWTKASIPLATAAMVLVAATLVFGSLRAQSTGQRVTLGAIIGMVFYLSEQIVGHLSLLINLEPALAALAPSVLLLLLAFYLFSRAQA